MELSGVEDRDLQKLVEKISIDYFHKPFRHRALFNDRLRTTGGRYLLKSHHIELNRKYYEQLGEEELIGIIKHELCHYHLHIEGRGYQHRDKDFKVLLKRVGGPRFCTPLQGSLDKKVDRKVLSYICSDCHHVFNRKRRMDTSKYVCGICRGKLILKKG